MGLRFVPRMSAVVYPSANSMAQIPVPVPKSRTFFRFGLRRTRCDWLHRFGLQR
jgi:hypothetical protein